MKILRGHRIQPRHIIAMLLVLALIALLLSGCSTDTTQNTFDAHGPVAAKQRDLFYLAMWPAIAVMILVMGIIVIALLRFRRRRPDELPKQVHGNTPLELAWTIAPALLLLGLTVPMVPAIYDLGRTPADDAFHVNVTGQRFSWIFEYPDLKDASGQPVRDVLGVPGGPPSMLHIPVGREVGVTITSVDVIHSFWIPKLAGKLDAIPGQKNVMWLKADDPGSYSGQCAEFCGTSHALMKLVVIAQNDDDFQKWAAEARAGGG